jgi:two-component system, sensor histidine kinase
MKDQLLLNKKILVADDNHVNQVVMKHVLGLLGGTAEYVSDGSQAVELLSKQSFDIVLMDIQMPVMDGLEATKYIRNQLQKDVPIIATTAFSFDSEKEDCMEAGMNYYLSKPFTVQQLETELAMALSLN